MCSTLSRSATYHSKTETQHGHEFEEWGDQKKNEALSVDGADNPVHWKTYAIENNLLNNTSLKRFKYISLVWKKDLGMATRVITARSRVEQFFHCHHTSAILEISSESSSYRFNKYDSIMDRSCDLHPKRLIVMSFLCAKAAVDPNKLSLCHINGALNPPITSVYIGYCEWYWNRCVHY